ncbi:MAG: HD domain-containing protein [Candidatus Omnitrophica bacterium]|nr:HD domain-containing protein [Candidatus Omnitrophota bacterium]
MPQTWVSSFSQHPSIQGLRQTLAASVKQPIWWAIPGEAPKSLDYSAACRTCHFVRRSSENRQICQRTFLQALEHSARTKAPHQFLCPIQRYAVCLPAVRNGKVEGALAICHSEQAFSKTDLELARVVVETSLEERERSLELKNLSDAIQPRCVALSTIHTIHRLISSTLDLEELLPRIARLCCQVLRAQACVIWLADRPKRLLVPRAVVSLEKGKDLRIGPCRIGVGVIGEAASSWQGRLKERMMVVPLVEEECLGVILVRRNREAQPFGTLDQEILSTLAEQAVVAIRNAQMYDAQERITWGTIRSLSAILDGMEGHSRRSASRQQLLANVALAIAQRMDLPPSQQRPLQYAALLHDAGRVGIPDEILRKPSKLEPDEFAKVKEHPIQGARFLEPLEVLEPAIPIVLYHHERYDGTGYPKGLKKEAIPLGARILAVANAFEAMISERPYRQAMTTAKAAREIAFHSGTQFDPKVVHAFLRLGAKRLEELALLAAGRPKKNGERGGS